MPPILFRRLAPGEFDQAHAVLLSAAAWLVARGIRQWTTTYPADVYRSAHDAGSNFGLFVDGDLAAVVTLSRELRSEWADVAPTAEWWLSKLATAPRHRGRGLGARVVAEAVAMLSPAPGQSLYLDCVHGDGFLVRYYERLGFAYAARRTIQFSTDAFDMVLMARRLAGTMYDTGDVERG